MPPHQGSDWYVATDGNYYGNGMIDNPITLTRAIEGSTAIKGGDTIWLRGGIYNSSMTFKLNGDESYITFRPYPGEHAILKGSVTLGDGTFDNGWMIVRNIEIMQAPTDRGGPTNPNNTNYIPMCCVPASPHCHFWNCVMHDGGLNFSGSSAEDSDFYGNISYNHGWIGDAGGTGYNLYIQNGNVGSEKNIKNNVFGPEFGSFDIHAYGTGGGLFHDMNFTYNVHIPKPGAVNLIGGAIDLFYDDIVYSFNHMFRGRFKAGYLNHQNTGIKINDNRLYNVGVDEEVQLILWWESIECLRNVITGGVAGNNKELLNYAPPTDPANNSHNIDYNAHHYLGSRANPFAIDGYGWYTWAEYKAFETPNFEEHGIYDTSLPATNELFVWVNDKKDAYDTRVGIILAWNWENLETVSFNVASLGMTIGKSYNIHQALDYFGDVQTIEYAGGNLVLSTVASTVAIPAGYGSALCETSLPLFGCWIIEEA